MVLTDAARDDAERIELVEELDGCARCFEHTDSLLCCRVRRWCWIGFLLLLTLVATTTLFIIYAVMNAEASSCRLTYHDNATISESQMHKWASDANWPLPTPTYNRQKRVCTCSSQDKDPTALSMDDYVPVWIAPADLLSLQKIGDITGLPSNIPNVQGTYDHVKVCLKQKYLIDLWGTVRGVDTHCHKPSNAQTAIERFFLGYEGALYCFGTNVTQFAG